MPELPEVQTTVNGLKKTVLGLIIKDVWSSYNSPYFKGSGTIKDLAYFKKFRNLVIGKKIISAERRAKNILINLSGGVTILVHLKMTGHLLYGKFVFDKKNIKDPWQGLAPIGLKDPFNRHIRLIFMLSNGKYLALSDMRKFAKVTALSTIDMHSSEHLSGIGPEPLDKAFTFERFQERVNLRPNGKVKQIIMDQSIVAGVGNIYADESLWYAGIHPRQQVREIPEKKLHELFKAIKMVLKSGVTLGGASTSDYRNIHGEMGESQGEHHAYRRTGEKCDRRGRGGKIVRITLGARGTHYCDRHQKLAGG
ncbi:MAG: bifunctional DNA-formamidopyrimidine glycosylase/DNA-(apurinic or apyrimidinic site) lyase [Candidatus Paceibacterota bacterium]